MNVLRVIVAVWTLSGIAVVMWALLFASVEWWRERTRRREIADLERTWRQ